MKNKKLLSMLGFAMRAGRLSCGTDKVCDEIRRHGRPNEQGMEQAKKPVGIVIIAQDASANTRKRVVNACHYYRVGCLESTVSSEELGDRIGKSSLTAVCATFDRSFVDGILKAVGSPMRNRPKRSE